MELFFVFPPRLIEYNIVICCILKHSYYCCTDCGPVSPSQLLSVHMCKGLEFRVRFEAFYGNDYGKRKHMIYITDGIENAGLSLHYMGI